jgi:hypothetical protein
MPRAWIWLEGISDFKFIDRGRSWITTTGGREQETLDQKAKKRHASACASFNSDPFRPLNKNALWSPHDEPGHSLAEENKRGRNES